MKEISPTSFRNRDVTGALRLLAAHGNVHRTSRTNTRRSKRAHMRTLTIRCGRHAWRDAQCVRATEIYHLIMKCGISAQTIEAK